MEENGLTFIDGYKTEVISKDDISYVRLNLDLNHRLAALFVGITPKAEQKFDLEKDQDQEVDGIALIKIQEGWFKDQVEDLRKIEKVIENKYHVQ